MAETLAQAVFEVGYDQTRVDAGLKALPGAIAATSASLPPLVPRVDGTVAQGQFVTLKQQLERQAAASPLLLPVGIQQERIAALESATKTGKAGLGGFGLSLDELGQSALFAAGTLGVFTTAAGLANFSIRQNVAYDDAAAAVRTLGINSDELGGKLRELSGEIGNNISTVDLLKASYDVASSGFTNTADAVEILKASALGATGGFSDINTVADATTSVLNAYGLSATNATKIVDGFIQTQNDGKIVVAQYAQEIGRVAPTAAAAGVSIQELNAAVSVATAQGVPVGSTFAGLRQAITSILKPTSEATELAGQLGLSFNAQALKAQGLGQFLANVAEKTGGAADANVKLFGSVDAVTAIQPLLNDNLATYNKFLANNVTQTGQAAKAAEVASNTISGSIKQFTNALSNIATQSDKAAVPVARLFQALTKITENLNKPADFVGRFTALGQIVTNVQKQLDGLANNPAFKTLFGAAQREVNTITQAASGQSFGVGSEEGLNIEREISAVRAKRAKDDAARDRAAQFAAQAAERDVLRPAREELRIAQRLFGLDGERLRQARQALDIEKLRREERKRENEFKGLGGNAAVEQGSTAAIDAEARLEAAGIAVRTEIVKGADELRRAGKEIALEYKQASESARQAALGFAQTVAGSRFGSESAQRQARETLERRAVETLNSGAVNRQAVAREFGLPIAQRGSLSIEGGGRSFQRSFTDQVGPLDLRGLSLEGLSKLVQETAPLADGAKSIQESNKELVAATKELTAAQKEALTRESNLAITVPVGATRNVYLP